MKKSIFLQIAATIVSLCAAVNANAQCRRDYDCFLGDNVATHVSFGAGATFVQDMSSPAFSVRVGMEGRLFIGELEGSYLSVNSLYEPDGRPAETNALTTMTIGVNVGIKFFQRAKGYLAVTMHTGYSLQEDWWHGDCCYYDYCDYYDGYGYYSHPGDRYHGKYYFGVGVNGTVDISRLISLFVEARYQSIPVDGCGKSTWGGVAQGGIRFYF